jgi:nitronate monooxygenase
MGLIDDIPTCEELISRIVTEAEDLIIERLGGMVTTAAPEAMSA